MIAKSPTPMVRLDKGRDSDIGENKSKDLQQKPFDKNHY